MAPQLRSKEPAFGETFRIEALGFPGRVPPRSGASRPRERPSSKSRQSREASWLERRPSWGKPELTNLHWQTCTSLDRNCRNIFCTIDAVATKKSDQIGPGTNLHFQTCTSLDENITKIEYSRSQESAGLHSGHFRRSFSLRQLSCNIEPVTTNLHLQTWTCQPGLANLDWPPRVDPEIPLGPRASLGVHGGPTKPRRPRTSVPAAPVSQSVPPARPSPRPRPEGPPRQPRFTAGTARVPSLIR